MKIVIDENMPCAEQLFARLGEVEAVNGRPLAKASLYAADALMVRSVTPVDKHLLQDTAVKFVGTATAGTDHINLDDLHHAGIDFSAAPGCNAIAVVEYVLSALFALAERDGFELSSKTIGIVGVGNVGRRLQARCHALGMNILLSDPPRAQAEDAQQFLSIEELVNVVDIITLHTPLTDKGEAPTRHLLNLSRLRRLRQNAIIINACRGPVVDNQALLTVLTERHDLSVVLDVWEQEPDLNQALLAKVDIATAHIAGYTLEGKVRGTTQIFEAFCQFLGKPQSVSLAALLPVAMISEIHVNGRLTQDSIKRLAHLVYDVRFDDALLRHSISQPGGFDRLRKHYPIRREWSSLKVISQDNSVLHFLSKLGFTVSL